VDGTAFRISRATLAVYGIIITARTRLAARSPTPRGGPAKNGVPRSHAGVALSRLRTSGTRTKMPHRP
jgi:hypothetical protein